MGMIDELHQRVRELEYFAKVNDLKLEPHLYPKGLFKAKPVTRSDVAAYSREIKSQIALLESMSSESQKFLAELIAQKVQVLVNCFRTQKKRLKKSNKAEQVLSEINLNNQNAFEYFSQLRTTANDLEKKVATQEEELLLLRNILQGTPAKNVEKKLILNQQIGSLEKKLTLNQELLDSQIDFQ